MCNINVLVKACNRNDGAVTAFLQSVSSSSYVRNDDGDGIFTSSDKAVHKSLDKLNYFKFQNAIESSDVIVTHQRLTSSGHSFEFTHPFESEEFVLVHNGVINQFIRKEGTSDTYGFFLAFQEKFKDLSSAHISREEKIFKTLKRLLADDRGWYSIVLYDKKFERTYYFKNNATNINFYKFGDYLYISTIIENKKFIPMLSDAKITEFSIKDHILYRIEIVENQIKVVSLGKFYEQEKTKSERKGWLNNFVRNYSNKKSAPSVPKEYDEKQHHSLCNKCKKPAVGTQYLQNNLVFCEKCWEENLQ